MTNWAHGFSWEDDPDDDTDLTPDQVQANEAIYKLRAAAFAALVLVQRMHPEAYTEEDRKNVIRQLQEALK